MAGSKPGERRGGRPKGGKNKATLEREAAEQAAIAEATTLMTPELIDTLDSPAAFLDAAWRALAKAGMIAHAIPVAEKAAPYFNAKLAAKQEDGGAEDDKATRIIGGLPDN